MPTADTQAIPPSPKVKKTVFPDIVAITARATFPPGEGLANSLTVLLVIGVSVVETIPVATVEVSTDILTQLMLAPTFATKTDGPIGVDAVTEIANGVAGMTSEIVFPATLDVILASNG